MEKRPPWDDTIFWPPSEVEIRQLEEEKKEKKAKLLPFGRARKISKSVSPNTRRKIKPKFMSPPTVRRNVSKPTFTKKDEGKKAKVKMASPLAFRKRLKIKERVVSKKEDQSDNKSGKKGGIAFEITEENVEKVEEKDERKESLKKQMLPDLSPERNANAVSNVRKMLEGFIDKAAILAEQDEESNEKDKKERKESKKEDGNLINVEAASRKLVAMAQRTDWIAFDQALK